MLELKKTSPVIYRLQMRKSCEIRVDKIGDYCYQFQKRGFLLNVVIRAMDEELIEHLTSIHLMVLNIILLDLEKQVMDIMKNLHQ